LFQDQPKAKPMAITKPKSRPLAMAMSMAMSMAMAVPVPLSGVERRADLGRARPLEEGRELRESKGHMVDAASGERERARQAHWVKGER
jgi:hypothetical protein